MPLGVEPETPHFPGTPRTAARPKPKRVSDPAAKLWPLSWDKRLPEDYLPSPAPPDSPFLRIIVPGARHSSRRAPQTAHGAPAGRNKTFQDRLDAYYRIMNGVPLKPGPGLIPPHGGYETLQSYQMSVLVYDATVKFCDRFIDRKSRTHDQMVQAARSGNKNIAEGSQVSGTSKKTELKLVGVARGSLEELLGDYEDFLRQRGLAEWGKNHPMSGVVRRLCYAPNRSYMTYKTYIENAPPEVAGNTMVCLVHQTNYLLDQQLRQLEAQFLEEGGFTERLYRVRSERRNRG
jgi:four helix bundle suffix protein